MKEQNYKDSDFQKAVSIVAKYLLYKWDSINNFSTIEDALNFSIYLGGGHSFREPIRDFWFFEYNKGCKINLIKRGCIEVPVTKSYFLSEAKKIWNDAKSDSRQLLLFK